MKTLPKLALLKESFFRKNSVFRSLFLTILSLLLSVAFIFSLLLYRTAYLNMQQQVTDSSESFLLLVSTLADQTFDRLADSAADLAWEDTILDAVVFPDHQNRPRSFEVVSALKNAVMSTDFATDMVLLCTYDRSLYTSGGTVCPAEEYTGAAELNGTTVTAVGGGPCSLEKTASGQLFMKYRFIPCSLGYLGELYIFLDTDALFGSLCTPDKPLSVYSGSRMLLYSNTNAPISPEGGEHVLSCSSSTMDLMFFHSYDLASYSIWEYILTGTPLFLFLCFFLLIIAAFFVAWVFYRPLHDTIQSFDEVSEPSIGSDGDLSDWHVLSNSVAALNRKATQFRKLVNVVAPYAQQQLLADLTDGTEIDADSVRQTLSSIQSPLALDGHFVLFQTKNTVTGVLSPIVIEQTIRNLQNLDILKYRFYPFAYQHSILTVVDACGEEARLYPQEVENLENIISVFTYDLADCRTYHSDSFRNLLDIHDAYRQIASHQQTYTGASQISPEEIVASIEHSILEIPKQTETVTRAMMEHLLLSIEESGLPPMEMQQCYRSLAHDLYELARTYDKKVQPIPADVFQGAPEEYLSSLRTYLDATIRDIYLNLNSRQQKYLLAAQHYVESHYMDSDLSLNTVAAQLGISSAYLSRIFTEVCGVRFTQYLNELRIKQAQKLLADESKLIRDVSQEVGFLTIQNFMRVFKQKTGVSPSEYRSVLKNQKK